MNTRRERFNVRFLTRTWLSQCSSLVIVVIHLKNIIKRIFELREAPQMVFSLRPCLPDFVDPRHLGIREIFPREPFVYRLGLLAVLPVRHTRGILMFRVEEVDQPTLPAVARVRASLHVVQCCDDLEL